MCGEGVAAQGFTLRNWKLFLGVKHFLLNLLVQKTQTGRALVSEGSRAGWGPALCSGEVLLMTLVLLHGSLGLCKGLSWVSSNMDEPDQLLLCTEITLRSRAYAALLLTPAPVLPSAAVEQLMITPATLRPRSCPAPAGGSTGGWKAG